MSAELPINPMGDALKAAILALAQQQRRMRVEKMLLAVKHVLAFFARLEQAEEKALKYDAYVASLCPSCEFVMDGRERQRVDRRDGSVCCDLCLIANAPDDDIAEWQRSQGYDATPRTPGQRAAQLRSDAARLLQRADEIEQGKVA